MLFNPGTGGSITSDELEGQFYTLVSKCQRLELQPAINPKNVNIINFTIRDDGICSGSANIPALIVNEGGKTIIDYPDPFVAAGWVEGSGGDGQALNYAHALAQRAELLARAERNPITNPQAVTNRFGEFSWTVEAFLSAPVTHNGILNFSFAVPTEVTNSGDGETRKGAIYLP
ncbi:MAG: hypothetical protein ACRC8A_13280 [Microcoleaceae cyanobacterium]